MNRPEQHFRARLAVLLTGGALVAALFPMAGSVLAAVPAAPSQPDLVAGSDTGASSTDNITTDTTPTFSGTSQVGVTSVELLANAVSVGTAVPDVSGNWIITSSALSAGPYSFTAIATNADGPGSASTGLNVTIDTTSPTVSNVTSPTANGTYTAGTVIPITVTFSEAVYVTGTPSLTLATGSPASTAVSYTSGSGTATLTFTYTVAALNASGDLDYASTSALSGTIADTAGNAATLTLVTPGLAGSLGFNKAIVIDTAGPTVTINQAAAQADPTRTSPINFTVVFNALVSDFITGDVTFSGTAGGVLVGTVTPAGPATTYNVAVTGMTTSGTVVASLAAGVASNGGHPNAASTSTDNTVTWDVTPPTVTINQAASQADPTGTSVINFTVVFSEAVTGFATGEVTLSASTAGGSKTGSVTGNGTTYNVAVTGMATTAGTVVATVAAGVASDAVGNLNTVSSSTDNTVSWDPFAGPTVTINQASGQADPTATSPINFTVVFGAPVTGFDASDVTLTSTAGSVYATVTASSTSVYTVAVYGMSTSGTVTATIAVDRALSITGSHPSQASTSTDNTVTFRVASKFLVTSSSYSPVPGSAVTITAQLADSLNNAVPVSGVVVTWSSTGGGSFSTATSTTNASGIATVTFTVSTTNGTVHTVSATGGGFTGTSTNITVSANPATITLTRSRGMITYGESDTFSVQFGTGGANRSFVLEYTSVGVPWTTIANLVTNSAGFASLTYAPTRTGYVRARFAGTTDLGAATSGVYIVGVRQTVTLSPHHAGTKAIARGTSVTFSTTVRPLRADLAPSMVTFRFYQKVSGAWVLKNERHVATNTSGVARTTFTFGSRGGWYVRAYAPRTLYNSISRFTLREYYLVP